MRKVLLKHCVAENDIGLRCLDHLGLNVLFDKSGRELFVAHEPIDFIVGKLIAMVSLIGHRVVDLIDQQLPTIIWTAYGAHEPRLYRLFKNQPAMARSLLR